MEPTVTDFQGRVCGPRLYMWLWFATKAQGLATSLFTNGAILKTVCTSREFATIGTLL